MTNREFFLERRKAEHPAFVRVLHAIPGESSLDYKPHERSPSARQLVWSLAAELRACLDVVIDGKAEWKEIPTPPLAEMIGSFERWSKEIEERVGEIDDKAWEKVAPFYYEGKVVSEQPVGQFLWFIHFDSIHHRGQLSAYLRPMGGKVPSIYGPSADDPGEG
jgi:uncharacterized damage-inducible protein DinB